MEEGYGKARRGRRQRAGPYSRPARPPAPAPEEEEARELAQLAPGEPERQGLLASLLQRGASLITKVPVLGSYFAAPAAAEPPADDGEQLDEGMEQEADVETGGEDGSAAPNGPGQPQPLQPLAAPAAAAQQRQPVAGSKAGKPAGRRVAFQSPVEEGEGAATPPPQRGAPGASEGGGGEAGGTPYDNVLALLRQGPLAANSPRSFPRPRSSSLLTAGAGRTPGPGLAFGASPVPAPSSGESDLGSGAGRRGGYLGSRLNPGAGASGTPSTGIRTGLAGRSASRFTRTPVHMQPLAAGVPGGSSGAGAGGTSRFGLAAAAAAAAGEAGGATGATTGLLSPAPLAWTPMRSNLGTGGHALGSGKRKAESASPDAGDGGNISLLDAQRRIRHKSEPAAGMGGEAAAAVPGSADRRAWRAGRTPFVKGAGLSRFGAAQQQERSISPALPTAEAQAAAPAAGSKATTDTARRILATLDALDKVVAASPPGGAAAAVAAALAEPEKPSAASPPPTDSLGFAGLPRGEPAPVAEKRSVTFGGVSFAPSPTPASSPMAKTITGDAAAPAVEPAPAAAAAPAPASSGWGEAFLAANRAAMAKATEAAKAEAEGGSKQAAAAPPVFSFGLPPPAAEAPAGDTPKLKQRLLEPQAEPPAAGTSAAEAPVPAPAAPLFGFAKPAAEAAQPQQATEPQAGLFAFGQPKSVAKQAAAEPGAPKFTFGGSRSGEADRQVAAVVASASPAAAAGPAPKFEFGGKATAKQEAALTPPPAAKPADPFQANQAAAEAAKSPLPDSDLSDSEEPAAAAAAKPAEPEKAAPASGGWDLDFLKKNQAAAKAATEAAAKEAAGGKTAEPAAGAPKFSFGAPPASSAPAPSASVVPSFLMAASSAAATGSEAAAPKFSFGAAPSSSAAAAPPLTFGASASSAPAFNFGAASSAAAAVSEAPAAASSAAAATGGSGWGEAFLKANQAAAAKAAEAAAKEIQAAAPGAGSAAAAAPAASSAPAFTFGLPASGAAASTAPSAPTFTFGSEPSSSGAAPATTAAAGFNFGAPASAPAAGGAAVSTPASTFGSAAASSAAATSAAAFKFGGTSGAADAPAASVPAFGFAAASTGAAAAPASAPAFAFGASSSGAASAPASAPAFAFGAASGAAAAPASSPSFGFGAGSSAAASAPAAATQFGFGSTSSGPAAGAASTPSLGFGASAPAGGFAFGASQPASSAAFQFGGSAAPAASTTPASGGFAFGSGGFGAANGGMESDMMDNNGGAPASSAGFQFGGASSTPAFGSSTGGFAFGAAPAPQPALGFGNQPPAPASQPAFAFGSQPAAPASQPAFGFGGAAAGASQPAFAFGGQPAASASQPAFGFGSQPAVGAPQQPMFGAPQQPAFGAQQPAFAFGSQQPAAPGAMVPNNPFGGGMGGGGAFSIGSSGGGSHSESGRRKLKVKRPGRKVLLASRVVCALASGASFRAPATPIRQLAAPPSLLPPAVCKRPSDARVTCSAAATDGTMVENNPLLTDSPFPAYSEVKAEHVVPGIRALLAELHAEVDKLERSVEPTWEGLVQPLERVVDRLSRAWGTVSHLKAVKDTEELRKAVEEVQPERVKLSLRLSQSKPLYEAFKAIKEGPQWGQLTEAQQRIVDGELRDFVLGGVALEGEAKERFNEIQQELSQLSTKFSNNVLDATKAYKKLLTDKADVEGLPESALALAAQQAAKEGHEGATPESGPWLFTLDFPSYFPVMTHAKNRALREEMYRQSITRASTGDIDNTPIIEKVLALRQEKAELLGFNNFAEVSMASKMATLEKAEELLEQLRAASYDAAQRDLQDIKDFAAEQGFTEELQQWDVSYWAERLKEAKYALEEEQLRPYFALPNVLEGLFGLAKRLFDVDIEPADGQVPVWHEDVRFFCVKKAGEPKAYFYLDPYSRPAEKRGGAWMDEVCGQSKLFAREGESVRLPVAHMVCNQTPPVGGKPSLMTFREVETLFHEFGHAAQHMLTEQQEGLVAGIRGVEWDAVELPSQFMENWCYDRKTLYQFAKHHETGEPLPEELYQRLLAARTYRSGSMTLRQIHFASVDLELHARFTPGKGESVFDRDQQVARRTTVMPPLPEDRFLCSFSHIFAGGYSAGYYSYKWAEVLSADAFAAFEEAGLDNEEAVAETGRRFRDTVLGLGGGRAPQLVFQDFRGREPTVDALLRHNNLLPSLEVAGAAA